MNERDTKLVHAYHDDELGAWSRRRFEARLGRSPELRRELSLLEDVGEAARVADIPSAPVDLWSGIASALPRIDAEVVGQAAVPERRRIESSALWGRFPVRGWGALPLGAAALAASALVAIVLSGRVPPGPSPLPPPQLGAVRFLDTDGRAVMILDEADDDVTIIWLVDGV